MTYDCRDRGTKRPRYTMQCNDFTDFATGITQRECKACCRCSAFGSYTCENRDPRFAGCGKLANLSDFERTCEWQNRCQCRQS